MSQAPYMVGESAYSNNMDHNRESIRSVQIEFDENKASVRLGEDTWI